MMDSREMGRLYMKGAGNAVATIADHNRKSLQLSGASALRSWNRNDRGFWSALSKSTERTGRIHRQLRRSCPQDAKDVSGPFRTRGIVAASLPLTEQCKIRVCHR